MIKKFSHNNPPELNIMFLVAIMCIMLAFVANTVTIFIILGCLVISLMWYLRRNSKLNKDRFFLSCNHSIFFKNRVWINQKICISKKIDGCPKAGFMREMRTLLDKIPDGTVCYCCTHELIKKHILKKYPQAEVSEAYIKDLRKLKKEIETKKCRSCSTKDCTIFKNEKNQFYSIKFIK